MPRLVVPARGAPVGVPGGGVPLIVGDDETRQARSSPLGRFDRTGSPPFRAHVLAAHRNACRRWKWIELVTTPQTSTTAALSRWNSGKRGLAKDSRTRPSTRRHPREHPGPDIGSAPGGGGRRARQLRGEARSDHQPGPAGIELLVRAAARPAAGLRLIPADDRPRLRPLVRAAAAA